MYHHRFSSFFCPRLICCWVMDFGGNCRVSLLSLNGKPGSCWFFWLRLKQFVLHFSLAKVRARITRLGCCFFFVCLLFDLTFKSIIISQEDFSFATHKDLFYIFHFVFYKQHISMYFCCNWPFKIEAWRLKILIRSWVGGQQPTRAELDVFGRLKQDRITTARADRTSAAAITEQVAQLSPVTALFMFSA